MKKISLLFLFAAAALISCKKSDSNDIPGDPVNISTELYQREVIDSANSFAFKIFGPNFISAKGDENVMISPFSISSALSMTMNGSAGTTLDAMRKTLGVQEKTLEQINDTYLKLMTQMLTVDKHVDVKIANSVWVDQSLTVKKPFITSLQTSYKAEVRNINFDDPGSVSMVNNWISEKTNNKIRNMLDELDPASPMLLINAIYFNGKWRYQFDKSKTKDEPFYTAPSVMETVPMMQQTENLKVAQDDNVTLVELPYGQGNYTMVIALPDENVEAAAVVRSLTTALWQEWMTLLDKSTRKLELHMPRFSYTYKRLLNQDLIDMGMGIAFGNMADFSNMSDQSLQIDKVLHQTFIDTKEEGTEAAAVTVVVMGTTSANPEVIKVTLNRPFLYFIRESSTGTILFMGRVADPLII